MDEANRGSASPVRVALVGCSGMLGEIIGRAIAGDPGLQIVADIDAAEATADPAAIDADLVLWNDAEEPLLERWLAGRSARCAPRILATLGDGRDASLWELTPRRTALGALSPTTLVETIRHSAAASGGNLP